MRTCSVLLILLGTAFPVFSQLAAPKGFPLSIYLLTDSITGEMTAIKGAIDATVHGKLLVQADPNDLRKDLYDNQLLIDVIHARKSAAIETISLTGLRSFEKNDVLRTLRPGLQPGDRIVLTFKMMSEPKPSRVFIIEVK